MKEQNPSPHKAFTELPIVDISQLYSRDVNDRLRVAECLDKATKEAGFFYLTGHQVGPDLIDALLVETKRYFAQPISDKMQNYIGYSNNHSGYVPQGEEQFYGASVDLKEAYDIGPESSSLMFRFFAEGENQWPESESFRKAASDYYSAMRALSEKLFAGFALALELPETHFSQFLNDPPSQLRLVHYFDNPEAKETDSGIGAHTDYEFFTILLPTSPGLQVLNGAGDWISVPLIEEAFVINIGDMMELISAGKYVATSHRVRQVKEERYSFPFFASLDYETPVKPILQPSSSHENVESIICGDHLLAQTMQTFSYLKQRLAKGEIHLPRNAKGLSSFGELSNEKDR